MNSIQIIAKRVYFGSTGIRGDSHVYLQVTAPECERVGTWYNRLWKLSTSGR